VTQPISTATGPDLIAAASAAPAEQLGQRVDLLNQSHPWMPHDMTMALATSDTSDNELTSIADSIKQTLASTWDGFNEAVDDPVLHKQPTTSLALARYLTAAIGPLPVAEPDLNVIQLSLQKAGYGKDLAVNGVWDGGWNSAYNQWASDLRARQIAGAKPGSVTTMPLTCANSAKSMLGSTEALITSGAGSHNRIPSS